MLDFVIRIGVERARRRLRRERRTAGDLHGDERRQGDQKCQRFGTRHQPADGYVGLAVVERQVAIHQP
jgi:hypothetical protein